MDSLFLSWCKSPSRLQVIIASAFWISLFPNLATIKNFAFAVESGDGFRWLGFVLSGWLFVFSVTVTFLILLGLFFWGKSIRWMCAIALVVSSALGYYSYFLGTQFDRVMLVNILQTHPAEAMELMGWRLATWVVLVGVLPAAFLLTRKVQAPSRIWRTAGWSAGLLVLPWVATILMVALNYQSLASATRNRAVTFHTVAPTNLVTAGISYAYSMHASKVVREAHGKDAQVKYPLNKPRLVVLVVGETARAQSHSLNGYERETNPKLQKERIVYFKDTRSCGTSTAISVPCIFSGLTQDEFSLLKARGRETLIDTVRYAKTQVLWRDNDSGCKDVCDKAQVEDFSNSKDPRWCPESGNCFDEILLDGLESKLDAISGDVLVVLHLKGSHGPAYFKRYPSEFERFKPTCQSGELSSCDPELIRNAYDNTILYTDHVLSQIIALLKKQEQRFATAMLYASDHGESLGEGGLFLHGMPYSLAPDVQTRVPMLAWFSSTFIAMERWSESCIYQQNKTQKSHDNIYHTVLGLLDIAVKEYRAELDIFKSCDTRE